MTSPLGDGRAGGPPPRPSQFQLRARAEMHMSVAKRAFLDFAPDWVELGEVRRRDAQPDPAAIGLAVKSVSGASVDSRGRTVTSSCKRALQDSTPDHADSGIPGPNVGWRPAGVPPFAVRVT